MDNQDLSTESEHSGSPSQVTVYQNKGFARLDTRRIWLMNSVVIGVFILGASPMLFSLLLLLPQEMSMLHAASNLMIVGILFASILAMFIVSRGELLLFGQNKLKVRKIEERLISHTSPDLRRDLESVIDLNLRLRRHAVADFYSQQLLRLTGKHGAELPARLDSWMASTECWVSTPQYHKSVSYWAVFLFETKGMLCLTDKALEFHGGAHEFMLPLQDIDSITVERHSFWIRPVPLRFIQIKFREHGEERVFYLSPTLTFLDSVFHINGYVSRWEALLTTALVKSRKSQQETSPKIAKADLQEVASV